MRIKGRLYFGVALVALAAALAGAPAQLSAQQAPPGVNIGATDLGGVVTGPNGPEAGVWVIAETKDLPTRFAKIVVTDDQGRYVLPDLPKAKYQVWVRGYGLVDSPKVESEPGKQLNLTAVPAPNAAAAAQYYPAIYWYSMLKIPDAEPVRRQERHSRQGHADRLHQPDEEQRLRRLPSARHAGDAHDPGRVRHLVQGCLDAAHPGRPGRRAHGQHRGRPAQRRAARLSDGLDRPHRQGRAAARHAASAREGIERNVVVTTWDWSDEKHYLHDLISTDKRNPTVNGDGPLYGQPEYSMDYFPDGRSEDQHRHPVQGADPRRRHA